jgi:hypothetical protein
MKMGQNAYQMSLDNARQAAKDAREKILQGREDAKYARDQTQQAEEDNAVQQYGLLTSTGKRNDAGIQVNDEDFENAVRATGQGLPMPAAAPQQPEWTPATDLDRNQGLQAISRARRDWNGVHTLQKEATALNLDVGRKAELKRLKSLSPEQFADVVGDAFSRDGSGIDAMLTYDPKTNKFLFASKVPGMPSQTLSRAELENYAMGIWEAGNGDFNSGMATVLSTMKTNRELSNANYDRSVDLAKGDAELYFKGRAQNNDDQRTRNSNAELGLRRETANKPVYTQLIGPDGKAVLVNNKSLKEVDGVLQLPPGHTYPSQRPEIDQRAVVNLAESLVGSPVQGLAGTGAPQMHTPESAYQAALTQMYPGLAAGGRGISATDQAIASRLKGGGGGGGGENQAAPALAEMTTAQLTAIARKPRGVSSQEASMAQQELDNRRSGAPTLKAW